MKTSKIITGCALAAGLMAFAPVQSHASLVISNSVVTTLNIKATAYALNDKGQVKKVSISNKDILKVDGAPNGAKLAYWNDHVVIIANNLIWDDLTTDGVLTVTLTSISSTEVPGNKGAYKYIETGTEEIVYSTTDYGFDVTGVYTFSASVSAVKNGFVTVSLKYIGLDLAGEAFDINYGDVPITASGTGSGSGKVPAI